MMASMRAKSASFSAREERGAGTHAGRSTPSIADRFWSTTHALRTASSFSARRSWRCVTVPSARSTDGARSRGTSSAAARSILADLIASKSATPSARERSCLLACAASASACRWRSRWASRSVVACASAVLARSQPVTVCANTPCPCSTAARYAPTRSRSAWSASSWLASARSASASACASRTPRSPSAVATATSCAASERSWAGSLRAGASVAPEGTAAACRANVASASLRPKMVTAKPPLSPPVGRRGRWGPMRASGRGASG